MEDFEAVSYTHLDVYKRQSLYCAFSIAHCISSRTTDIDTPLERAISFNICRLSFL